MAMLNVETTAVFVSCIGASVMLAINDETLDPRSNAASDFAANA
jgi:hypothetical protein